MKSLPLLAISALVCWSAPGFAQQPAPSQSNLESGGLRPPEAVDDAPPAPSEADAASPETELEKADKEDSGRGLEWVWLNAEIGAQHLGLQTFKGDRLVDSGLVKTTQTGLVYGAGAGVRILVFTVGARFRLASFSEWQLWTLGLEGGFHIPIGRPSPTSGRAGYASLGSFSSSAQASSQATAKASMPDWALGSNYLSIPSPSAQISRRFAVLIAREGRSGGHRNSGTRRGLCQRRVEHRAGAPDGGRRSAL